MKNFLLVFSSLAAAAVLLLLFKDYQNKEPLPPRALEVAQFNDLRTLLEEHKVELSDKLDLEQLVPTELASISSPFCAAKYHFENTIILEQEDLVQAIVHLRHQGIEMDLEQLPEQVWFTNGSTYGVLLQTSGGIGFFRDYYHELVYDPNDRIEIEQLDEKCYPTIAVEELGNGWKYRIISSQWD